MPTELQQDQKLKRIIRIHGIGLVEVTVSLDGLMFRVPKTRKYVTLDWTKVVKSGYTPMDVPSFLMGKPFEFLEHEAKKVKKKAVKKATGGTQ